MYQFKIDLKGLKATPYGEKAESLEEVSAADMSALEQAMYDVC